MNWKRIKRMRRAWILTWILILVSPALAAWQTGPDPLLPDLQTYAPYDLHLSVWNNGQRKALQFSNAILNDGIADLVFQGDFDQSNQTVAVVQVISHVDGTTSEAPMGTLIFHGVHNHWHWEGFSLYEVWSVHPGGRLDAVVASSGKVSFCMRDDDRGLGTRDPSLVSTRPKYTGCGWQQQGLSVGWVDIYDLRTPGQTMDISNVPDGIYALVSTTNPEGLLLETDTSNNRAITYFRMAGRNLTVLKIRREPADRYTRNGMDTGKWVEKR